MITFRQAVREDASTIAEVQNRQGRGIGSRAMAFLDGEFPRVELWCLETLADRTENIDFYKAFGTGLPDRGRITGSRWSAWNGAGAGQAFEPCGRIPMRHRRCGTGLRRRFCIVFPGGRGFIGGLRMFFGLIHSPLQTFPF